VTATPLAIPDEDFLGVLPTIEVPDSLTIGDVDVRVKITHTALADLELKIKSPGVLATMWDDVLDINNFHCSGDDMDIVLDDESPNTRPPVSSIRTLRSAASCIRER